MFGKRGSVLLFLSGLPAELTRRELKGFVQSAVREIGDRPSLLKAAVSNCSILRITDPANGRSELHGLVEVQPATAGMRAIQALNGQKLKGATLSVRRYHQRSILRDRPPVNAGAAAEEPLEERRRSSLKIELINA